MKVCILYFKVMHTLDVTSTFGPSMLKGVLIGFPLIYSVLMYRSFQDLFIGKPIASSREYARFAAWFPEAKFVVCWRHAVGQLVSVISLLETLSFFEEVTIDKVLIRQRMVEMYDAVIAMRQKHADDPRAPRPPPAGAARPFCVRFTPPPPTYSHLARNSHVRAMPVDCL